MNSTSAEQIICQALWPGPATFCQRVGAIGLARAVGHIGFEIGNPLLDGRARRWSGLGGTRLEREKGNGGDEK